MNNSIRDVGILMRGKEEGGEPKKLRSNQNYFFHCHGVCVCQNYFTC